MRSYGAHIYGEDLIIPSLHNSFLTAILCRQPVHTVHVWYHPYIPVSSNTEHEHTYKETQPQCG